MRIAPVMRKKLEESLSPTRLDIVDESHRHAGHMGHRHDRAGESHFSVTVVSGAFAGKSRIERHRMVNALLAEELAHHVHALALATLTPEEDGK